jgi:D-3-phosphoglycerate dehydrogenase/(S)-sulfolactate dehydrogenase
VLIVFTTDQPGVVGKCGHMLGEAGINIADMTFCRKKEPNTALISMNLDSAPADGLLDEMRKQDFVASAHYMELPVLFNFE